MKKKTTPASPNKPTAPAEKALDNSALRPPAAKLPNFARGAKVPSLSITPPKLQHSASASPEAMNSYQSAAVFIQALAANAGQWKRELPEGFRPAVLALLYGGMQVNVTSMAQVSFHGIQIEGTLDGNQCSILAHQSTVQVLCFAEEIVPEAVKRPIGFIWSDGETEI